MNFTMYIALSITIVLLANQIDRTNNRIKDIDDEMKQLRNMIIEIRS